MIPLKGWACHVRRCYTLFMQIEGQAESMQTKTTVQKDRLVFAIITEIMRVMNLRGKSWARPILGSILRLPVSRLAEKLIRLDENVAALGWSAAMGKFLADFVTDYQVKGLENVPRRGPVLIVCNHPGSYDMPILSTVMGRDDLKIIASDISIIRQLPSIMEHFIFISTDPYKSMLTVRSALRHLMQGGGVLIFPRGDVEPDQGVTPGGMPDFEHWSSSLELFLRKAPQTRVLAVFAKGVLSRRWFNSSLARLWKKPARRQKVAEVFQVAQQLIGEKGFSLTPSLSFSTLLTVDDLGSVEAPSGKLLNAMIQQVRGLIEAQV